MYVKRSCPKCGQLIEGWTKNYITFGQPYKICPNCKTILNCQEYINEWFLMDWFQKLEYVFIFLVTGTIVGLGVALIIGLILNQLFDTQFDDMKQAIKLGVICIVPSIGYTIYRFRGEINASLDRSRSSDYMTLLNRLGYLDKGFDYKNFLAKFGVILLIALGLIYTWSK